MAVRVNAPFWPVRVNAPPDATLKTKGNEELVSFIEGFRLAIFKDSKIKRSNLLLADPIKVKFSCLIMLLHRSI